MSRASMCRLCLNKDELIYTFDDRLANGYQLRMCILLCTGVEIKEQDNITKMVCHKCCSLAVKLYQYRQTALANDKALKEFAHEPFEEPPANKDAILELHKSILENISQCKVSESVAQVYKVPLDDISPVDNDDKVTKDDAIVDGDDPKTHETVKKIFQYFPTAIVPREILDSDVLPSIPVDRDIQKYIRSEYEVIPADNSDGRVLKFKRKYPTTDVVKLAVKRPRREPYSNYFSDSDSSIPPVFKSRKKNLIAESDASYSDCDSDVPEINEKPRTPTVNKPSTRSSKSKILQNPLQFPDSDSDSEVLADAKKPPQKTNYCEICDRTFYGWSQLKSHQRTHLKCIVCRIICDSQEDLEYHVRNICYKNVENNQPYLTLPKVDEDLFLLDKYHEAFDRYYEDIQDGVYGPTEPPPPPDPDYPLYHNEEHILKEAEYIKSVFEKHKYLDNTPIAKNKVSQTRRAETHIKYYSRNHIVLQDMYQDLGMYKVPVNVVVNPRVSAHISYASKPIIKEPMDRWVVDIPIDIVVKQKDPTYFLRPKRPPPISKSGPLKTYNRVSKQEKHPKLMKALTTNTTTTTTTTATSTITTTAPSTEKAQSYNIAKLLSTTTTTISHNSVPKTVSLMTKMPARISKEVSLVPKQQPVPSKSATNTTSVYTNIMFRLPVSSQNNAHHPVQKPSIAALQAIYPKPPLQQACLQPPSSYVKEEMGPDIPPPAEIAATPPTILQPPQQLPPYPNIQFKLPPTSMHNQNDGYLKQEKDNDDNTSYTPPQMNRSMNGPNMTYQNPVYRMPLTKPPHVNYNQPPYPTQPPRFRPPERRNSTLLNNQQYYNMTSHQNDIRYRNVSGGTMMMMSNPSGGNQEGSLLSQIPPPPTLNSMPATHLLQSMNHMSGNLGHHSPINHQMSSSMNHPSQQNHVNSMYMNSSKLPSIGKMSPISSVPSPIHSVPSPINSNPMNSPINSMPPPLNNYNGNSYNNNPSLYDHSYADTYSSNSYGDSYSSTYLPQQYIPPYSPHSHMDVDPFVDQMLQQAAGTNKTSLRVKQPWELNQG